MRTMVRGKLTLLYMAFALVLGIPAVALASDLNTDVNADLSSGVSARTEVEPNSSNNFRIKVWATGNLASGGGTDRGIARIANTYNMPSGSTITAGSSTTELRFKTDHNYGSVTNTGQDQTVCPAAADVPAQVTGVTGKGCKNDPFIVPANLVVGNVAPDTNGTLTVTGTTGAGLDIKSFTWDQGYVKVVTPPPSDTTPPTIGYTLNPATPDGSNGWYKSNVSLTWHVVENESPASLVKTGCVNENITSDQAATTYKCSASSDGGTAVEQSVTIKRDATPPQIDDNETTQTPNAAGWFNSAVVNSFSASDAISGLVGPANFTKSSGTNEGNAVKINSGLVSDLAGNTNPGIDSAAFKIDLTKPNVSVTGVSNGATYTLGSVPTAGCNTTDALSGVDQHASVSSTGGPVGSVIVDCNGARDNAGNTNSASVTYNVIYNYSGFFRPVDNLPTLNSVKAGSAVPIKFSLDGNQGLNIIAANFPKVQPITCDTSAPIDAIEETVTAGGSSLQYDASLDQYTYVWKTDKASAGKCVRLDVKFIDGTTKSANFKLLR